MRSSHELATLREQAVRLRREGKSRSEIKKILGFIGNSTLNQLLRDEPLPERATRTMRSPGRELPRVSGATGPLSVRPGRLCGQPSAPPLHRNSGS